MLEVATMILSSRLTLSDHAMGPPLACKMPDIPDPAAAGGGPSHTPGR